MNCEQVQTQLAAYLYGDADKSQRHTIEQHLASCPACTRELAELQGVRGALNQVAAPPVHVDLAALYRQEGEWQRRRLRRWRRLAWTLTAAAAVLFLILFLRVEVRWDRGEVVIGWNMAPVAPPPAAAPDLTADVNRLRDLVHALAANADHNDQRRDLDLAVLEARLDELLARSEARWTAAENGLRALYVAHFGTLTKGDAP